MDLSVKNTLKNSKKLERLTLNLCYVVHVNNAYLLNLKNSLLINPFAPELPITAHVDPPPFSLF